MKAGGGGYSWGTATFHSASRSSLTTRCRSQKSGQTNAANQPKPLPGNNSHFRKLSSKERLLCVRPTDGAKETWTEKSCPLGSNLQHSIPPTHTTTLPPSPHSLRSTTASKYRSVTMHRRLLLLCRCMPGNDYGA